MIFFELLRSFFIIGAGTFGGGFTSITMIEYEIVTVRGWITSAELSDLIAIAQMTPGPVGVNAATYTGFRVGGLWGAAAATIGFTLPSVIFCFVIINFIANAGGVGWIDKLRKSVRPAVVGLIIAAVLTYGRTAVADTRSAILAAVTFGILALSGDKIHPLLLILGCGAVGILIYR